MDVIDLHTMRKEESAVSPLSVALGNFDGVHSGHRSLIEAAVKYARDRGIKSAVWTFNDSTVPLPNKPDVKCITPTAEKLWLIASLGVDYAFLADFSDVKNYSPTEFVQGVLKETCHAVCAVCGFNFRFGAGGAGTCDTLRELMSPSDCIIVPPVCIDGNTVSSTAIRKLIEDGNMEKAAELLGHPFFINEPVVKGKQLGQTIGIPTVNQYFKDYCAVPKNGIYVCTADIDGNLFPAVANVGIRPTIENDSHRLNCETHIIGYSGMLYDRNVKVSFMYRLRGEMKFDSLDALRQQIHRDIQDTLAYFENNKTTPRNI